MLRIRIIYLFYVYIMKQYNFNGRTCPDESSETKPHGDVAIIIHNNGEYFIASDGFTLDVGPNEISCPRCRMILETSEKLKRPIKIINENATLGICDQCEMKNQSLKPCKECKNSIFRFKNFKFQDGKLKLGREKQQNKTFSNKRQNITEKVSDFGVIDPEYIKSRRLEVWMEITELSKLNDNKVCMSQRTLSDELEKLIKSCSNESLSRLNVFKFPKTSPSAESVHEQTLRTKAKKSWYPDEIQYKETDYEMSQQQQNDIYSIASKVKENKNFKKDHINNNIKNIDELKKKDDFQKKNDSQNQDKIRNKLKIENKDTFQKNDDSQNRDEMQNKDKIEKIDKLQKKDGLQKANEMETKIKKDKKDKFQKLDDSQNKDEIQKKSKIEKRDKFHKKDALQNANEMKTKIKKDKLQNKDDLINKEEMQTKGKIERHQHNNYLQDKFETHNKDVIEKRDKLQRKDDLEKKNEIQYIDKIEKADKLQNKDVSQQINEMLNKDKKGKLLKKHDLLKKNEMPKKGVLKNKDSLYINDLNTGIDNSKIKTAKSDEHDFMNDNKEKERLLNEINKMEPSNAEKRKNLKNYENCPECFESDKNNKETKVEGSKKQYRDKLFVHSTTIKPAELMESKKEIDDISKMYTSPINVKTDPVSKSENINKDTNLLSKAENGSKMKLMNKNHEQEENGGIIQYALSDRQYIEKGWTVLPVEKVLHKKNVFRMHPAHPEFDWFAHNKNKAIINYEDGKKFAEFDDGAGRGRWYYKNGNLALDYYDKEDLHDKQRVVVYSDADGEADERGRKQPNKVLATFDYDGNGVIFDHSGKIRLKYDQNEGVVLDQSLGPVSNWKWHNLNRNTSLKLHQVRTEKHYNDPEIRKLGKQYHNYEKKFESIEDEEMIAIELENTLKEQRGNLNQGFSPYPIKIKALKINEKFSLRVIDQSTVYLLFRDGKINLKLNLGMIFDSREIVSADNVEVDDDVNMSVECLITKPRSYSELKLNEARQLELACIERRMMKCPCVESRRSGVGRAVDPLGTCSISSTLFSGTLNSGICPYTLRKPSSSLVYCYNSVF